MLLLPPPPPTESARLTAIPENFCYYPPPPLNLPGLRRSRKISATTPPPTESGRPPEITEKLAPPKKKSWLRRWLTSVPVIRAKTADPVSTKTKPSPAFVMVPTRAHCVNMVREPTLLLLQSFPYLRATHEVFILHLLRFCASSLCTPFAFGSFRITSLHLSFCFHIFRVHSLPSSML